MVRYAGVYGLTLVAFLVIDLIWLGIVAKPFYDRQLGAMRAAEVNWGAAFLFYAIYVGGVLVLAVWPAFEAESLGRALLLGGTLGLVAYAAFDLTSLAVLEGFPAGMVLPDMIWGTVLTAATAAVGFGAARWLLT